MRRVSGTNDVLSKRGIPLQRRGLNREIWNIPDIAQMASVSDRVGLRNGPLSVLMRWQRRLKKNPGRLRTFGIAAGGFTTVCLTFSVGLLTLRNRLTATKIELADIPDSTESNALSGFSSGLSHMTELVDTLLAIGIASTTLLILLGGYFYVFSTARLEHLSSGRQDTLPTEIGTTADEV